MRFMVLGTLLLAVAALSREQPQSPQTPPQQPQQTPSQAAEPQEVHIQEPSQLMGKKVIVGRGIPLCEPRTYNSTTAYYGKQATVIGVKPGKHYGFSQAVLNRLPEQQRQILLDQDHSAMLLFQFEDGKKYDTCAQMGPRALSDGLQLAPGETLGAAPATKGKPAAESIAATVWSPSQGVERLSDDEVRAAMAGKGNDHWVRIDDMGLMAAQGALGTVPHISLYLPEAIIFIQNGRAKKQFLSYEATDDDRERALTVVATGYIGKTYQEGCDAVTRVVLISDPSGGVVEEAYRSDPGTEAWANAFGATNYCQWLRTKFSLAAVKRVQAAAKDGEFYVAVFSGGTNTKTYKIKHKHQSKLGLN